MRSMRQGFRPSARQLRGLELLRSLSRRAAFLTLGLLVVPSAASAGPRLGVISHGSLPGLIAFTRGEANVFGIFTVPPGHPTSMNLIYAPASGCCAGSPRWSPDGKILVFWATDDFTPTLVTEKIVFTDRSGRIIDQLLRHHGYIGALAWSPNGADIAYICRDTMVPTELDICILDVATGKSRTLTHPVDPPVQSGHVSWSPSGNRIAFDSLRPVPCADPTITGCKQPDIALANVATGQKTFLTHKWAMGPAYSPDGAEIAYVGVVKAKDGSLDPVINLMSSSGAYLRQLVPPGDMCIGCTPSPAWSPDGKKIVFEDNREGATNGNLNLFTVNVTGQLDMTAATESGTPAGSASWGQTITTCTVPRLKGKTLAAATSLIKRAGCVLGKVTGPTKNRAKLHVVSQSPAPNADVPTGSKVNVRLG